MAVLQRYVQEPKISRSYDKDLQHRDLVQEDRETSDLKRTTNLEQGSRQLQYRYLGLDFDSQIDFRSRIICSNCVGFAQTSSTRR